MAARCIPELSNPRMPPPPLPRTDRLDSEHTGLTNRMKTAFKRIVVTRFGYSLPAPALLRAVKKGWVGQVKRLISEGVDLNCKDCEGRGLLHLVALEPNSNSGEMAIVLINNGADVNAKDIQGQTPLHLAVTKIWYKKKESFYKFCRVLLEAGADLNSLDNMRQSPVDLAYGHNFSCVNTLGINGGNRNITMGTDYEQFINLSDFMGLNWALLGLNKDSLEPHFFSKGVANIPNTDGIYPIEYLHYCMSINQPNQMLSNSRRARISTSLDKALKAIMKHLYPFIIKSLPKFKDAKKINWIKLTISYLTMVTVFSGIEDGLGVKIETELEKYNGDDFEGFWKSLKPIFSDYEIPYEEMTHFDLDEFENLAVLKGRERLENLWRNTNKETISQIENLYKKHGFETSPTHEAAEMADLVLNWI